MVACYGGDHFRGDIWIFSEMILRHVVGCGPDLGINQLTTDSSFGMSVQLKPGIELIPPDSKGTYTYVVYIRSEPDYYTSVVATALTPIF